MVNTTVDKKKVPVKPAVKPTVGPVSVKSEKVTKKVSFKEEVKKPAETPKSQIRILKRSEQSWSPKGSEGASTSQQNVKSENEKDLCDKNKVDETQDVCEKSETLKQTVQRPKTKPAWVPQKI